MQNQEGLTPAERELETVLAGLKPHVAAMNRDRLMFQAGRASARRGQRLWQGLACSLAIILLASILVRPKPAVVEAPPTLVANNVETATVPCLERPDDERLEALRQYVRTRRRVLERGVDVLARPTVNRPSTEPVMNRRALDAFLSST